MCKKTNCEQKANNRQKSRVQYPGPHVLHRLLKSVWLRKMGLSVDHTTGVGRTWTPYINNCHLYDILSGPFKPRKGIWQRCVLSPILFTIFAEFIMRKALEQWHCSHGRKMRHSNLRYADNTTRVVLQVYLLWRRRNLLKYSAEFESELVSLTDQGGSERGRKLKRSHVVKTAMRS